jgi:hypothetical protein
MKKQHVCQGCLNEFDPEKLNTALIDSAIQHKVLFCDDCLVKLAIKNAMPFSSRKKKEKIDVSGLIGTGDTTNKGKKKYWFVDAGKLIKLVAESGLKRELKPATEADIKKLKK